MAAYNAGPFVEAAVTSVCRQTMPDLELIVVNDGSKDETGSILDALARKDRRIRVRHQENTGFAGARNAALELAKGDLVAVADADDFQMPERIERLVKTLEAQPETGICGGSVESWSGGSEHGGIATMPTSDEAIRSGMPFESMVFDPTVMYRRSVMAPPIQGYCSDFRMAVDYNLWARLLSRHRFANRPEVLTRYRRHTGQVTNIEGRSGRSLEERRNVWSQLAQELFGIQPSEVELQANQVAATWPERVSTPARAHVEAWLERLWRANGKRGALPAREFGEQLSRRWLWVCARATDDGLGAFRAYARSPISRLVGPSVRSRCGLIWRCLFRRRFLPANR